MMQPAGIKMIHVPYKGIAPAMTAILAGEIEITYVAVLTGLQHFKAGKLSPLAVAGRSRYPALPEVPTAAEAGLAGYEIDFWYALLGPARMPGEPRAHRILLDVAHAREQMRSRVHGRGVVGFVPHRVLVAVGPREVMRVARGDRGHQARRACGARRREEQMHVISHQRIS